MEKGLNFGRGRGGRAKFLLLCAAILIFGFVSLVLVLAQGTTTVSTGSIGVIPEGYVTEPIMVENVMNLGGGTINVSYNSSVVHVTNVADGSGNALTVVAWNVDNSTNPGCVRISAYNTTGKSGDVIFANVTYKAVGAIGSTTSLNISVVSLFAVNYSDIEYSVVNGSFKVKDATAPVVTNANATPGTILNDNGRPRAVGTNITRLNVTVTDNIRIASVTIDLSAIGGSAVQAMSNIPDTNVWTVTTNASAGINVTSYLVVNATDTSGNSNTSVSIPLEVLRRGDVVRDNVVNMEDMMYIARYTVGLEPEVSSPPSVFVGDIVGEGGNPCGDGKVDMKDALYIARKEVWQELEP